MITISGVASNMIANNLTPYEPTHPGEVLKEEVAGCDVFLPI
jgi:hypothetical protein